MYSIRVASLGDVERLAALHERENNRPASRSYIAGAVSEGVAVIACDQTEETLGLAYGVRFGPEIIELGNLLVAATARRCGLGSALVGAFERQARTRGWRAVVLTNSKHYERTAGMVAGARAMYRELGYQTALDTPGGTRLLFRAL